MKKGLLAFLAAFILFNAPWRLATLYVDVLLMPSGFTRISNTDSRYWEVQDLQLRLERSGWTVIYKDGLSANSGLLGMTTSDERTIYIDSSMHWDARYAVLAHEAGHTMQPFRLTSNQGEAFAESVAMLISHDGYREHARYLSALKTDFLVEAVADWRAIYRTAAFFEGR